MKFLPVVVDRPPNYAEICAAFNPGPDTIFAFRNQIWNPGGTPLSVELFAHEAVHCERQGQNPEAWWRKYIDDVQFRADEELVAHQAEYATFVRRHAQPQRRRRYLAICAVRLSGPLYGRIFSYAEAERRIARPT